MNILFLTTTNLATNPRLVKEVKLALDISCMVTVVTFRLGNWSDAKSDEIARELNSGDAVNLIFLNATRSSFLSWLCWGFAEKLARLIYPLFKGDVLLNALGSSRRSFQILHKAKKITAKPDLICAHNPGALYPAWRLSKKWKVPFIFDVEDYHPGEFIRFDAVNEKRRREFLMKKLLPDAAAITSASPLIGKYTLELIGGHPGHQVILNSFSQKEFSEPENQQITESEDQLKVVWFSQKISFGRGLEQLFDACRTLDNNLLKSLQLTLIGDMDELFYNKVIFHSVQSMQGLTFEHLPPMPQAELHAEISHHDIGLALEFDTTDLNRQLCLTNKILAYAQAGLYILATDTPAQRQFVQEHDGCGLLCGQTVDAIRDGLLEIERQRETIISQRLVRFENAKGLAWENEAGRLKGTWGDLLLSNVQISKLVCNN